MSPILNSDYVYQQLIQTAIRYYTNMNENEFARRPRIVEGVYYQWLTRMIDQMQTVRGDRTAVKNEIYKVHKWFREMDEYMRPEEERLKEEKERKRIEELEYMQINGKTRVRAYSTMQDKRNTATAPTGHKR